VLDRGRCGLLVQPACPEDLGEALHRLLASAELRRTLGSGLRERVGRAFSREAAIQKVCEVYAAT
jgi:glycosyltransferase involved in cell wall biosynthesis